MTTMHINLFKIKRYMGPQDYYINTYDKFYLHPHPKNTKEKVLVFND